MAVDPAAGGRTPGEALGDTPGETPEGRDPGSARGLRGLIERLLRVPPRPEPPAGSPGSVRVFRAAPGFYRYKLLQWGLGQAGAAWGLVVGLGFVAYLPEEVPFHDLAGWAELLGIGGFLLQLPLTFLMVKIDYDYRWYVITDRSLRIREGVVRVREQTMSFANIQNLTRKQGPLQRLFGIEDLRVRTAGGGGGAQGDGEAGQGSGSGNLHLGYFRGVDRAGEIRDAILQRLRTLRDAGLGDPEEGAEGPVPPVPEEAFGAGEGTPGRSDAGAAARELLAAARELRLALGGETGEDSGR